MTAGQLAALIAAGFFAVGVCAAVFVLIRKAGLAGSVPAHLRDSSYRGAARLGHGRGYRYPHDYPEGVVAQPYAPDPVAGHRYYEPSRHGAEARYAERSERIRAILGRADDGDEPAPSAE